MILVLLQELLVVMELTETPSNSWLNMALPVLHTIL